MRLSSKILVDNKFRGFLWGWSCGAFFPSFFHSAFLNMPILLNHAPLSMSRVDKHTVQPNLTLHFRFLVDKKLRHCPFSKKAFTHLCTPGAQNILHVRENSVDSEVCLQAAAAAAAAAPRRLAHNPAHLSLKDVKTIKNQEMMRKSTSKIHFVCRRAIGFF